MTDRIEVYTDGACFVKKSPKWAAGAAVVVEYYKDKPVMVHEWGRFCGEATNNYAELTGIKLAVEQIILHYGHLPCRIVTDSQYCCGLFDWTGPSGWRYQARKNRGIILPIRKSLQRIPDVEIMWVRGHSGVEYNEAADRVATWCKHNQKDWAHAYCVNGNKCGRGVGQANHSRAKSEVHPGRGCAASTYHN